MSGWIGIGRAQKKFSLECKIDDDDDDDMMMMMIRKRSCLVSFIMILKKRKKFEITFSVNVVE